MPEWLFGWAAAIVLVISFVALAVLWPKPRLEEPGWRPLPGGSAGCWRAGRSRSSAARSASSCSRSRSTRGSRARRARPPTARRSSSSSIFWLAPRAAVRAVRRRLPRLQPVAGDRPGGGLGRRGRARGPTAGAARLPRAGSAAGRPPPGSSGSPRSSWSSRTATARRTLAVAALVYSALTFIGMALYGVDAWIERGEAFSVYFNLFSRISPFETRDGVVGLRRRCRGSPARAAAGHRARCWR